MANILYPQKSVFPGYCFRIWCGKSTQDFVVSDHPEALFIDEAKSLKKGTFPIQFELNRTLLSSQKIQALGVLSDAPQRIENCT